MLGILGEPGFEENRFSQKASKRETQWAKLEPRVSQSIVHERPHISSDDSGDNIYPIDHGIVVPVLQTLACCRCSLHLSGSHPAVADCVSSESCCHSSATYHASVARSEELRCERNLEHGVEKRYGTRVALSTTNQAEKNTHAGHASGFSVQMMDSDNQPIFQGGWNLTASPHHFADTFHANHYDLQNGTFFVFIILW